MRIYIVMRYNLNLKKQVEGTKLLSDTSPRISNIISECIIYY